MSDISDAMASDALRESVRFFATADEMYAWLRDNGKAFVEKKFAGRLSEPFSTHDAERLAVFGVDGRGRVGSFMFRYRVEPAGPKAGRAVVDLYAEAVWIKPRFLADSFKAGLLIQDAKRGLWGHAEEQFEAAPD